MILIVFYNQLIVKGEPYKELLEGDIAVHAVMDNKDEVKNAFTTEKNRLWENGLVPYIFKELEYIDEDSGKLVSEPVFGDQEKKNITDSLQHISENVPCIKFR